MVGPSSRAEGEGWIEVGKKGKGKAVTEDSWALLACAEASPSVCNAKKGGIVCEGKSADLISPIGITEISSTVEQDGGYRVVEGLVNNLGSELQSEQVATPINSSDRHINEPPWTLGKGLYG